MGSGLRCGGPKSGQAPWVNLDGLILAAVETISGKVEKINVETGTLRVETDEDESKEMTVSKDMLQGLQLGDEITIKVEEGTVQSIEQNDEDK